MQAVLKGLYSTGVATALFLAVSFPFPTHPQDSAATASPQTSYPESAEGLRQFLNELFVVIKSGDAQKPSQLLASLAIPNHNEWFIKTFGAAEGPRLEAKYVDLQPKTADSLKAKIVGAAKEGKTVVTIRVFQKPQDTRAPLIDAVLKGMAAPIPIYNASSNSQSGVGVAAFLGYFVYIDGGFRNLDWQVLQALSTAPPMRVKVGNARTLKLTHSQAPVYPELARERHIQGLVALHVIISRQGAVQQVEVIKGNPLLVPAAIDAAKVWRYEPTMIDDTAVEVDTELDIIFALMANSR